MVKISDFLNTETRVALQEGTVVQDTTKQLNSQSTQAEGQYVDSALREMSQAQSIARQENQQAIQLKAQEKFQLNNIFNNLQEVQLKTVSVLGAINETNRKQQEATMAASYVGAEHAKMVLDLKKGYQEALSSANPDGSDLFERVQTLVNDRVAQAEAKAPNPLAVADIKKIGQQLTMSLLGTAIDGEDKLRTNYTLGNVQTTLNIYKDNLRADPNNTDAYEYLKATKSILENSKLNPLIVDEAMRNSAVELLSAQIDGHVGALEFEKAYSLVENKDFQSLVSDNQQQQLKQNIFTAEKTYLKEAHETNFKAQTFQKLQQNEITDFASPKEKEVAGELALQAFQELSSAFSSKQINEDTYLTGMMNYVKKTNRFIPPAFTKAVGDTIQHGTNPELVAQTANAVIAASRDSETNMLYGQLSTRVKAEAGLVARYMQTMSPAEAVKKARFMVNEFDDASVENNVKEGEKELAKLTDQNIFTKFQTFDDDRGNREYAADVRRVTREYLRTNVPYTEAFELAQKDVNSKYMSSKLNKNTLMSNGEKYGEATTKDAVEKYYRSDKELELFTNVAKMVVKNATSKNETVDWNNRRIVRKLPNGLVEYEPFVITAVPNKTELEHNKGMPKTFQIINPEKPWENALEFQVDDRQLRKTILDQEQRKENDVNNYINIREQWVKTSNLKTANQKTPPLLSATVGEVQKQSPETVKEKFSKLQKFGKPKKPEGK